MREEGTTRPSSRAVQRLASDVGGEVSDLRAALHHALDEADRYEADGRPDRAAAVLAEQRDVLAAVHQRLEDRLAEAAVEREAEGVLAAAEQAPAPDSGGSAVAAQPVAPARRDDEGMGLRMLASAAAAVVGVVLLLSPEAGGMLTVAGWSSIEDGGATGAAGPADTGERDEAAEEPPVVVPVWPALHDLAIPEASDLRPRPVSDDPTDGQGTDRTEPSPPEPADGPVEQVLDGLGEVEDLVDTALDVGAGTDQGTGVGAAEDDGAQHDADADGSPPDAEDDTGSGSSSESGDTTSGDESAGTDDSMGSEDDEDSSTGPAGTDASAETDSDTQDDQQDDPEPGGSSSMSGLSGIAPSDDETTGAGR